MILEPFAVHSLDGKTFYEGEAPKDMTADDIKALVGRLMTATYTTSAIRRESAEAITALLSQVESLTLENQRLRVDAERYRWIRQGKPLWVKVPVKDKQVEYFIGAKPERLFPERFDAAIDAARSQSEEKP